MKFTKEEISLCEQIVKRHRKSIQTRDFVYDVKYRTILLVINHFQNYEFMTERSRKKMLDIRIHEVHEQYIPLWSILDCLEFIRGEGYEINLHYFNHLKGWYIQIWNYKSTQAFYSSYDHKNKNKTALGVCLKAVLAVLEEMVK